MTRVWARLRYGRTSDRRHQLSSIDQPRIHCCSSSRASAAVVPLMQIKQDFTFEIQDERLAGIGTLGSCRTVQRFALTQSFNRLPVVLAQSTKKTVVRTILLDGLR